jgi:hypothetical protein
MHFDLVHPICAKPNLLLPLQQPIYDINSLYRPLRRQVARLQGNLPRQNLLPNLTPVFPIIWTSAEHELVDYNS